MSSPAPDGPAIVATGLTRRFGRLAAVDGASFTIAPGEVFGLLGHNGAGKTTTIRLLNGILRPTDGQVSVFGRDPDREGEEVRRRTGVLTETPALEEGLTARENLGIYGAIFGVPDRALRERTEELLGRFGMLDHADTPAGGLSIGMKQRIALARALIHDPEVLFLDEPTSRMDPVAARSVRLLIATLSRERGRTVVLCTHNLAEAQELCDRVAILEQGRVIHAGTSQELARAAGTAAGVRFQVDPLSLDGALPALTERKDVLDVRLDAEGLLVVPTQRSSVPEIVAALVGAGVRIYSVVDVGASLEEAYVALHQRRVELAR